MAVSLGEGVQENNKLVHYVAKRFQKRAAHLRIEYDDLISEGMIGLIKALQKFDESYGVKFSTYAVPMIEGQIRRFFRDTNPGPKFSRLAKELAAKLTGEETVKEITEKFHVSKWRAEEALAYKTNNSTFSIDMKLNDHEDKDLTLLDLIEYQEDFSNVEVDDFLSTLPTKLKRVAHLAMKDLKQQEIADKIGCSQVEVSRRLKKIRDLYQEYFGRGNEGMNLKHIRLRIIDLIDQHGDSFDKCQGCPICTEIKQLRKQLTRKPEDKFKSVLEKGQDMTRSDIALMIEQDVPRNTIRTALKMGSNEFGQLLRDLGLSRTYKTGGESEMGKLEMTAEEFVDLKYNQKLTFVQIAKLKGVADPTIHNWKDRHADEIRKALKALNLPAKEEKNPVTEVAKKAASITIQKLKQPAPVKTETKAPETKPVGEAINEALNEAFAEKSAEYERLIAALRNDLNTAHQQLDEKDEKIRNLEHLHDACEDCENEISSLQQAKEDLERKLSLEKDIEQVRIEEIKSIVDRLEGIKEENHILRQLVKKWA